MARTNKGPKLKQNAFGVYEVRWTENGRSKRVSARTTDIQEAQRFFAGWLHKSQQQQAANGALTVRQILAYYEENHVEEQVIDKRRIGDCIRWLNKEMGDLTTGEVTSDALAAYKRNRRNGVTSGRKIKDGTIRRELVTFNAAFEFARKNKKITIDDVPVVTLPPQSPPRDLWLDESEEQEFLSMAADTSGERLSRVHRFVAIALETAARRKSIEQLRWKQVDLAAKRIAYGSDGKRQKNKRRVPVPISDRLLPILQRAWDERGDSEYVLDTPFAIQHHFEALVSRFAKRRGEKFFKVTCHTLRHTWATLAARAGVDLYEIAGVLGDTLATVEKNYLHHCPDHLRKAVNFKNKLLRMDERQV